MAIETRSFNKISNIVTYPIKMADTKKEAEFEEKKQKLLIKESLKPFTDRLIYQCVCCGEILTRNFVVVIGPGFVKCPWTCDSKMRS